MSVFPQPGRLRAAAVHLLTASGAVLGLLALLAAAENRWEKCFALLGAALAVDAVDGPLARRFRVKTVLPRFSGETLDLVIDYLTYVTVPAFMIAQAGLVPEGFPYSAAALVMLSSLYHFADQGSKEADGHFVGFPAIWNLVVFYLFAIPLPHAAALVIILLCAGLTFVPLKWVHPVRVRRWRFLTLALTAAWGVAAIITLLSGFPAAPPCRVLLLVTLAYAISLSLIAGISRQPFIDPAQ
jgi:phosphatidylcholine synthase